MKKALTIFVALLIVNGLVITGFVYKQEKKLGQMVEAIPQALQLKTTLDKILTYEIIKSNLTLLGDVEASSTLINLPVIDIVKYDYVSTNEVPLAEIVINKKIIEEDLSKRTSNSQHFKIEETATTTEYEHRIYGGSPFFKDSEKWFNVETATTTLDAWNAITKLTFLDKIKRIFINNAAAIDFYATTNDGRISRAEVTDPDWGTIRNGNGTNNAYTSLTDGEAPSVYVSAAAISPTFYLNQRAIYPTDFSSIPDGDTITAATFNVYVTIKDNGMGSFVTHLAQANPASTTNPVYTDYQTVSYTSFGSIAYADISIPAYASIILNSTGLSAINKTGFSNFYLTTDWDINNNFTGTWSAWGSIKLTTRWANYTGTNYDPYFSVTSSSASPPSPLNNIILFE